ncbi:MAG: hypothetical protein DRP02_12680 [Candidatus Gerdarchaeota archaeon]|nr:MAG: hypothetical protein DRP02_12680 [Candidatus Gerdarchaeota archaeon]
MSKLCRHLGPKISHGNSNKLTDTRLNFCKICGEPIIETVLDVVAYLSQPRKLVNGKIVREYLTTFGKIDFILENVRYLNAAFVRTRGRPPSKRSFPEEMEIYYPREWDDLPKIGDVEEWEDNEDKRDIPFEVLTNKVGSGRMPGKTLIRLTYWAKKFYKTFSPMMAILVKLSNLARKQTKDKGYSITRAFFDTATFLEVMAKACLKLKKSEIKAVYACSLVKNGFTYKEASKLCRVKYETIKSWESYLKAILKKTKQFKNLTKWPPVIGIKIKMKNGKVVGVIPSPVKGDKLPEWVKIKYGKIVFEKSKK